MRSSGSNGVCEWEAETTEQGTRVMVRLTIPKPRFNLLNYNLDPLDGSVGVDRGNGKYVDTLDTPSRLTSIRSNAIHGQFTTGDR